MEEKQFHNQVYWITFLFSLLVVWVHSFNAELYLGAMQAAAGVKRLEWILGEGLGQISVPGFFMVSSYLFYRRFNWSRLLPKWKSRIRSILVPYLIWNFLYYAGYVAATRIPAISGLIGKPPVPVTIMQSVDALVNYAYNPVFWYHCPGSCGLSCHEAHPDRGSGPWGDCLCAVAWLGFPSS